MTAYIVFIRNSTNDPAELAIYAGLAAKAPFNGLEVFISKANRFEVLEGEPAEALSILRFPSWDQALAWYRSPEYAAAREHRFAGSDTRALLVEGGG